MDIASTCQKIQIPRLAFVLNNAHLTSQNQAAEIYPKQFHLHLKHSPQALTAALHRLSDYCLVEYHLTRSSIQLRARIPVIALDDLE